MKMRRHSKLIIALLAALANALSIPAEDADASSGIITTSPWPIIDSNTTTSTNITSEQRSTTNLIRNGTAIPKATKRPKPIALNDCPTECRCDDRRVDCDNARYKTIPSLSKTSYVEFSFKDNPITSVSLNSFPPSTESIDLSNNLLKIIDRPPASKRSSDGLPKLNTLNLNHGQLENISNLTMWKLPQLLELDVSGNPIKEINQPITFKSLKTLIMDSLVLTNLNESVFSMLNDLEHLYLHKSIMNLPSTQLPNQIFSKNLKLKRLDLSYNRLPDVPVALRSINTLEWLRLDGNWMTSLRPSDFLNQTHIDELNIKSCPYLTEVNDYTFGDMPNLTKLILSDNPKLRKISMDAFVSKSMLMDSSDDVNENKILHELDLIDLSRNNLTTLHDPRRFKSISFKKIILQNNPWTCDCNLSWLSSMPMSLRSTMHCMTPALYKDIEVSQFIKTVECDESELNYQKIVLVSFLVFLLVLTIAVFAQKTDLCRRFQMRDQYGTIYYTKASFPTETV